MWNLPSAAMAMRAKVPYRNFILFLNITTVIDNIIIKKGINYLFHDGEKYHQKRVLPSFAERKRQATFPETDTEVPIRNSFRYTYNAAMRRL